MTLPDYQWLRKRMDSEEGRANIRKAATLEDLAKELGMPLAQMAVAWCLKNPNVSTVILGASNAAQLRENLGSVERTATLTDEVMERIEKVLGNRPELPTQL